MPTPDYQRIAQLERELGIGQPKPEPAVHTGPAVCLIKNCNGDDVEIRNWTGLLMRRIHQH
ncbi:hypothetical protein ACFW2V_02605 [Streptomyces sp. NPDC058947]|uniref:hypothetical protein n=1 Tax=Streptomyces sp. NPDC058947 TaxID=3346675 RepID=UPI0036CDADD2